MAMNLHAVAGPLTGVISGTVIGLWQISDGYDTTAAGKRTPKYTEMPDTPMQVQALTGPELALLEGLNIQGIKRAVHMNGDVKGVDRASGDGGDLLTFDGAVWLVTVVLETWSASNWCRVAVTKQKDA